MINFDFKDKFSDEDNSSEVSLTPLIDTVLVLLIIFMAATPVINNMVKVSLPNGQYCETENKKKTLAFAIDQHGRIYDKNKKIIGNKDLKKILTEEVNNESEIQNCVFYVDRDAFCGNLIEVMDLVKNSGIKNVYFKTKKIRI